ncbi:MAG: DUF2071 domain-containing protein [Myxococcales bacterium]|nr:DUF2071 domain-containing protein [Myxococcales bacterium]
MGTELTTAGRPFLTAAWRRLCLLNYAVDPALLEPRLPPGLTLDLYEGRPYVSLVAFDFLDTRVLGVPWPGYRNFPEINLRFYVRHGKRRGVAFVREFVPKRLIAWMARLLYNEPYRAAPMRSVVEADGDALQVRYGLTLGGREHSLRLTAQGPPNIPPADSVAHFFKEHSWGFGHSRGGRLLTYEVRHPVWAVYRDVQVDLDWDWGAVYGAEWAALNNATPQSIVLAEGSPIAVAPKRLSTD